MKDSKHSRWDFHSVTWVMRLMPQVWDFGSPGVPRGSFFFIKHGHVAYHIDRDDMQNRMQVKILSSGQTGDLGRRSMIKYH